MNKFITALLLAGVALTGEIASAAEVQRINGDIVALNGAMLKLKTDGGPRLT